MSQGTVPLHEPSFAGNEWLYLKECLDSSLVSSAGPFVDRFETDLAAYTGAKHAIAVVNGTAALHIALKLAGVGSNDEVLVPALTFVATANAISYCNAIPHFVDCAERTLGVDAAKLRGYLNHHTTQQAGQCVNRSLALGPCVKKYPNDLALMVDCDGNMREPILNLLADHHLKDG